MAKAKLLPPSFSFTEINDLQLDQEWKRHCDAVETYAKKLAKAKKRLADAKAALELTEAEVGLETRTNGEGKMKVTDAMVKSMVILNSRVRDAVKNVNTAKFAVDMYEAAMNTLEHRKKSISDRVSLWMADYFKEPSLNKAARTRFEEDNKEVRRRRD